MYIGIYRERLGVPTGVHAVRSEWLPEALDLSKKVAVGSDRGEKVDGTGREELESTKNRRKP